MDWFVVFLVFVVLLVITLTVIFHKKNKKGKLKVIVRHEVPQTKNEDTLPPPNELVETTEDTPTIEKQTKHKNKPDFSYPLPSTQQKSHVRYDWQKKHEDSIISLFPEDSLAFPFLLDANRLEKEGARQSLIDEALSEARKLDSKAVDLYLARWSIIKKRNKSKNQ